MCPLLNVVFHTVTFHMMPKSLTRGTSSQRTHNKDCVCANTRYVFTAIKINDRRSKQSVWLNNFPPFSSTRSPPEDGLLKIVCNRKLLSDRCRGWRRIFIVATFDPRRKRKIDFLNSRSFSQEVGIFISPGNYEDRSRKKNREFG